LTYYRLEKRSVYRFIGILLVIGVVIGLGIGFGTSPIFFPGSQRTITTTSLQQVTVTRTGSGLVEYAFSPGRQCASLVIKWIQKSNSTIHVLIYSFTLDNIRDALIQAKNRGIDVKIVVEKSQSTGQGAEYATLKSLGFNIRLDSNSGDMHDKVAIIDGHIILTGSFNWSAAGNEQNNENLVVLDNASWAAAFEAQFQQIYNVATT